MDHFYRAKVTAGYETETRLECAKVATACREFLFLFFFFIYQHRILYTLLNFAYDLGDFGDLGSRTLLGNG